jgi:hypothetical protein
MKTHVLTVSRVFPVTHKRKGEETYFINKIEVALNINQDTNLPFPCYEPKLHTIRANYDFWKKRIDEVNEGIAILSVRYWTGKPYHTKQVKICQFDKDSGIGIQMLDWTIDHSFNNRPIIFEKNKVLYFNELSKNDGLSREDFQDWFKNYDLSESMAIIHFTKFRY